jgi:hypothetical protein
MNPDFRPGDEVLIFGSEEGLVLEVSDIDIVIYCPNATEPYLYVPAPFADIVLLHRSENGLIN